MRIVISKLNEYKDQEIDFSYFTENITTIIWHVSEVIDGYIQLYISVSFEDQTVFTTYFEVFSLMTIVWDKDKNNTFANKHGISSELYKYLKDEGIHIRDRYRRSFEVLHLLNHPKCNQRVQLSQLIDLYK